MEVIYMYTNPYANLLSHVLLNIPSLTVILPVSGISKRNIFGKYDLIITHHILRSNIYECYINIDLPSDFADILIGRRYSILSSGIPIYTSTLNKGNIFPINNIPLHLAHNCNIMIVIYDLPKKFAKSDAYISISIVESNIIDFNFGEKTWPPFNVCDLPNKLLIRDGRIGISHNRLTMDKYYMDQHETILSTSKCKYRKLSHLGSNYKFVEDYEYYCDEYSSAHNLYRLSIPIMHDVSIDDGTFTTPDFTVEVFKVPLELYNVEGKTVGTYKIYSSYDTLGDMRILSDKHINKISISMYVISTTVPTQAYAQHNFDLQFETDSNVTTIKSFDNINQLKGSDTDIEINVEFNDNISTDNTIYVMITKCTHGTRIKYKIKELHTIVTNDQDHTINDCVVNVYTIVTNHQGHTINDFVVNVDTIKEQIANNKVVYDAKYGWAKSSLKCCTDHSKDFDEISIPESLPDLLSATNSGEDSDESDAEAGEEITKDTTNMLLEI